MLLQKVSRMSAGKLLSELALRQFFYFSLSNYIHILPLTSSLVSLPFISLYLPTLSHGSSNAKVIDRADGSL
jgi:hypothetical protein